MGNCQGVVFKALCMVVRAFGFRSMWVVVMAFWLVLVGCCCFYGQCGLLLVYGIWGGFRVGCCEWYKESWVLLGCCRLLSVHCYWFLG